MTPPLNLNDPCPVYEDLQRLSDEAAWVLRSLARTRGKSGDLRVFDVKPMTKQISITRCVGDPIPLLAELHRKGFLDMAKKKARTTDRGNTLKHVLQALDSELTLFDSLTEMEDWRGRIERYRHELGRRCEEGRVNS